MSRAIKIFLLPSTNLSKQMSGLLTVEPHKAPTDGVQRLPHLLLYGPPGTGKTSTILALARHIYGAKNVRQMVLELNASDDRGIDVVREQIKTFASMSTCDSGRTHKYAITTCD